MAISLMMVDTLLQAGWSRKKPPEKEKFKECSEGQGKPTTQKSKDMCCRQRDPTANVPREENLGAFEDQRKSNVEVQ